jgi:phosphatidylglycerol---prolipoprotein diacylglyceryl transferase
MLGLLASFPSPNRSVVEIGPLSIHLYGLTLLVAIAACVGLSGYRWAKLGGDWDLVFRVAVWGVAFGIVGARLYHVVTSWNEVPDQWWGVFAVWKGGLGVWGGIVFGTIAGAVVVWRSGESVRLMMDCAAPGLLLAQGIGRIGNYFNQELFGKPTDLPWALEIDPEHRPPQYAFDATFHPTFAYEALYDFIGVGLLLLVGARFRIRPPGLFALYVAYYTFGRTFEELLRVDPAHELYGLRLNAYVSIGVFLVSVGFFVWWQFVRADPGDPSRPKHREPPPAREKRAVPKGRVRPSR